ncbi:MAG TPA: peptidoglycan editing factor PgeF [Blastocatellia bacterium]|nr:peptidoglycan editing factor PgeF [Blastocatellia bacterium]
MSEEILEEEAFDEAAENAFSLRECEVETPAGRARLAYVVCEPLAEAGFTNAFSTRLGGVSPLPREALNLTTFKGDTAENVAENRRRFLRAIGAEGATIVTARQTHSNDRCFIKSLDEASGAARECDALVTRTGGVLLGIQTADCLPILIGDAESGVMAAIHAGWRGTASRITERTVADLMLQHGVRPQNCIAALGPVACKECYEVGEDVIERFKAEFRYWPSLLSNFKEGGKAHLDVRAANRQQLLFCGFAEDSIYVANYCTMHQNELFFSHRCEGRTSENGAGRLLSVIGKLER